MPPTADSLLVTESPTAKLLVIDDEEAILRVLKLILSRASYEVTAVEGAEAGLRLLGQHAFDCVITDAIMPDLDGYELVKKIRAQSRWAKLPVLMLTRKRNRQDVKKAVEAGVTDYVLKPIDEQLLLDKVGACLGRKGGDRPHTFQNSFQGIEADAEVGLGCRILSLSEGGLTLRLPAALEEGVSFHLRSRVFDEIGIGAPLLKLQYCENTAGDETDELPNHPWEASLTFVGLSDTDLGKVRAWLAKQAEKGRV